MFSVEHSLLVVAKNSHVNSGSIVKDSFFSFCTDTSTAQV